ncbi:unnamed protein product, partial [Iphiclides podalirius]
MLVFPNDFQTTDYLIAFRVQAPYSSVFLRRLVRCFGGRLESFRSDAGAAIPSRPGRRGAGRLASLVLFSDICSIQAETNPKRWLDYYTVADAERAGNGQLAVDCITSRPLICAVGGGGRCTFPYVLHAGADHDSALAFFRLDPH